MAHPGGADRGGRARGKRRAGLSLADLRTLRRVLEYDTVKQAAEALGEQRSHLNRLMNRVAREVGADLGWRASGSKTLAPPAEVYRLVSAELLGALERASGFPTVSAGWMMQVWFQCRLAAPPGRVADRALSRLRVMRSADVLGSLLSYEVDIGLVHECAGDDWAGFVAAGVGAASGRGRVPLDARPLATWTAVAVGPADAPDGPAPGWRSAEWSPSDTAGRITALARRSAPIAAFLGPTECDPYRSPHHREPGSWLVAYEEARRGLPIRFVMPDLFIAEHDADRLRVVRPAPDEVACRGRVVAVHRRADEGRLAPLWDAFTADRDEGKRS